MSKREYSPQEIQTALEAFLLTKDAKKAADEVGAHITTVRGWIQKYRWMDLLRDVEQYEYDPNKYDKEFEEYSKELGLTPSDREVYKQIRFLEEVCICSIKGARQTIAKGLLPTEFKEALAGLKTCWDARQKIVSRTSKTIVNTNGQKVDYIRAVEAVFSRRGEEEEDVLESVKATTRRLVSGQ